MLVNTAMCVTSPFFLTGTLDKASTDNKVTVESSSGGDVNVKASFVATAANAIKTALKATTSMHGVDLEVDLDHTPDDTLGILRVLDRQHRH